MATSRIKTSSILQGFPKDRSLLAGNAAFIPAVRGLFAGGEDPRSNVIDYIDITTT